MYKVNYWDEDNNRINFYELSGHHAGECKVILKAKDGSNYTREYKLKVVEQDRTPVNGNTYRDGTIILNEEWYGHTNGGMNFLTKDKDIMYQVYERENPGQSFGCTSQYGTIWNDKLLIASKQAGDGGDPLPGGGRLVVARTMKCLYQSDLIDPSGNQCDGCGCLGIDEHKLYISTSNGVWIFDTDNYTVTGMVEGTANPNGSDGKPNTDPSGSLYHGQCGLMVRVGNRVFVAHQSEGLLVVDPATDKVTDVLTMKPIYDLLPDPAKSNAWKRVYQNSDAPSFRARS